MEALGICIDGPRSIIHHKLPRLWRFVLASTALLRRRRWRGDILDIWLGHAICISALARMLLSALQEVFAFAQSIRHSSGTPSIIVRREVRVFADLAFLDQVNPARPVAEEVYVGDASTHGWCLMSTTAHYSESNEAAKYHARWRFHD